MFVLNAISFLQPLWKHACMKEHSFGVCRAAGMCLHTHPPLCVFSLSSGDGFDGVSICPGKIPKCGQNRAALLLMRNWKCYWKIVESIISVWSSFALFPAILSKSVTNQVPEMMEAHWFTALEIKLQDDDARRVCFVLRAEAEDLWYFLITDFCLHLHVAFLVCASVSSFPLFLRTAAVTSDKGFLLLQCVIIWT